MRTQLTPGSPLHFQRTTTGSNLSTSSRLSFWVLGHGKAPNRGVTAPSGSEIREPVSEEPSARSGSIHIEFPGRAMIRVESGADPGLLRSVLESLRK